MKSKSLTFLSVLSLCPHTATPAFSADTVADKEADLASETQRCQAEKPDDGTLYCVSAALAAGLLYEESCDAGALADCHKYATNMIETGITDGDFQDIGSLFEKACNGGFADSCTQLSYHFRSGWHPKSVLSSGTGLAQDMALAVNFARRGCNLGSATACHYMGVHAYNGLGMEKDLKAALGYFNTVCDAGGGADVCANRDAIKSELGK
jgi:TPR repeat protein